ncbi:protein TAPETUM DETERMINANT 1-like [Nymphaea colorata]|nr:protein TAPETUM DETERMINANT 1-like [Nymphaea colorata]
MRAACVLFFICSIMLTFFSGSCLVDTSNATLNKKEPKETSERSRSRKLVTYGMCTNRDISISQVRESSTGIPQYIVQIVNTCMSGCAPSNIHLHCGWFASAKIVNPRTFKRVSYDDCLVNEGLPLKNSQIIRFTYSNSFMYPLQLKSARFC